MQLGLKNRLRLISLLPILVLLSLASYYTYTAYVSYNFTEQLQVKLEENKQLTALTANLSRERGMTIMYLGNSSPTTHKSLVAQRSVVDKVAKEYFAFMKQSAGKHEHKQGTGGCSTCRNVKTLTQTVQNIQDKRPLVDAQKVDFEEVFTDVYGTAQRQAIEELESLLVYMDDEELISIASTYLNIARAKEHTGEERDFISNVLARSQSLDSDALNQWISMISKSDALNYASLIKSDAKTNLVLLLENEESTELFEDITLERSEIMQAINDGLYSTEPTIWFTMLSEKANLIEQGEYILREAMDNRAVAVQSDAVNILIVALSIWIIAFVLAILGMLFANDITDNVKHLEHILARVAQTTEESDEEHIRIDTSKGATQAYLVLEKVIEQMQSDKVSAQEASEAKSMFLANMSHEIRTPLNGIVGFTELLKDTDLQDEQREFIDIIEKSSENLLEIINNILDLSKIESNKIEIEEIVFNPLEEFESAVEVYAVRASEKHIDLGCFIDPSLERPLKGDPTKIKEVVINLLSNAVKFTNSGGAINVQIRRLPVDDPNRARVRFEVQDSGIGVTSEQKARIFEAFGQADTSITRKYGGTGLGLTISSSFIDLMGGQLDLESEPGSGTTFFFELEFEEIETLNEPIKGSFANINAVILQSDSKKKSQETYLKEYLDYYGVKHTSFTTVDELQNLERQINYDLLFVDYDYSSETQLQELAQSPEEMVLITKSYYMKTIESMKLDILKVMYEPMNGTKIKTTLESHDVEAFSDKKAKQAKKRKSFDEKTSKFEAKCLVAEDNIINQKLIRRTLEDLGLDVTVANNGLEAFEKRKNGQYDIIFMDIQMPVLDGVEATQEILDFEEDFNQTHTPIIALTANALKGDRERFLAAGMDEYTTKPLVRTEIVTLLNSFLSHKIVDVHEKPSDTPAVAVETVEESALEPEAETAEETSVDSEVIVQEETPPLSIEEESVPEADESVSKYHADIILAKKNTLETKLFEHLLDELGYSYVSVKNSEDLVSNLKEHKFKLALFDKELSGLDLKELNDTIRATMSDTNLVMMIDPSRKQSEEDEMYVHEIIKNIINKDLLRLVFEKFI